MKAFLALVSILLCSALFSCSQSDPEEKPSIDPPEEPTPLPVDPTSEDTVTVAYGADLGWCTAMEDKGHLFYGFSSREPKECTAVMSELGVDALRLRVLVDPSDGYCNVQDVLRKAKRGAALGMRIMVAFHYTSQLASATSQTVPEAWGNKDFEGLLSRVRLHTTEVLQALKDEHIHVEWVQIGNETDSGFLFPMGNIERSAEHYVRLFGTGAEAARKIYPDAQIVVHLQRGYDQKSTRSHLDLLGEKNFDIIGFSLRPTEVVGEKFRDVQSGVLIQIASPEEAIEYTFLNMDLLFERYRKKSMLVEVGLPVAEETRSTQRMHTIVNKAKECAICQGIFYWEPESYNDVQYNKGVWSLNPLSVFLSNGRPTNILEAFEHKNR